MEVVYIVNNFNHAPKSMREFENVPPGLLFRRVRTHAELDKSSTKRYSN